MALKKRQTDAICSNAGASSKALRSSAKSKQATVVSMLLRPEGATIAAMTETTGWKPHSVRGFLTGIVRKKLKLKLGSEKTGEHRIYRIKGGGLRKTSATRKAKSRAA
jgi:hypothetical protein